MDQSTAVPLSLPNSQWRISLPLARSTEVNVLTLDRTHNTGASEGLSPSFCLFFLSATSQVSPQSWRPRQQQVVTLPAIISQCDTVKINTIEKKILL